MWKNNSQILKETIGDTILLIDYVENEYYGNLSGNWTNMNPNNFLPIMLQIGIYFKSGKNIFFTNHNESIRVSSEDGFPKAKKANLPIGEIWICIENKSIERYKFWKCQAQYSNKQNLFRDRTYLIRKVG